MCELHLDDSEPCTIWRENRHKARKVHKCDSCYRQIMPGQEYLYHFNVFDGDATTEHICAECANNRQEFADEHGGYLVPATQLSYYLQECISDEPESAERWQPMIDRIKASREAARCDSPR